MLTEQRTLPSVGLSKRQETTADVNPGMLGAIVCERGRVTNEVRNEATLRAVGATEVVHDPITSFSRCANKLMERTIASALRE
jgi:hypothetical protein